MRDNEFVAETTVSEAGTRIPARIRRELGVEDGDRLRWRVDGERLHVTVVHQRHGTFDGFEGYDGETATEAGLDHDDWGVG